MTTNKNDNCFDYYEANWNEANNKALTATDTENENLSSEELEQLQQLDAIEEAQLELTANTKEFIQSVNENLRRKANQYKPTPKELESAFKRAKANNMSGIETLYQWFLPLVKSISYSYSCYTALGEDAENICWEQFYIFVKDYNGDDYCRLPGLIKKRLLSRMADIAGSRKYYDPLVEYDDLALEECATPTYDCWEEQIHNIHLKAALAKLKPIRQNIIYKRYVEDFSGLKTTKLLNISYKAYRYHHHKALNQLRQYYLEHKLQVTE